MALLESAIQRFATLDTVDQVRTLRRVGLETDCADKMLGHLRGMYPDRFAALAGRMDDDDLKVVAVGLTSEMANVR